MSTINNRNTETAFEILYKELQASIKTPEIEDAQLMQHLDCKGCGKID